MKFPGQIVWITGASSGIGEALAYAFAREGARLVLSSRRPDELERVRRACVRPDDHLVVTLDLSRVDTLPLAVSEVLARRGHVDLLINNGGVSQRALAQDASLAVERALMEVNYFGPVALTKALLPFMLKRASGHIVVVSSVMGYVGTPGRSTYAAAKHALHGWFDSLRAEIWCHDVQVTIVCPGYVRTAVSDNAVGALGDKHGRTDRTHREAISAEACAAGIIRGLARGREEIYIGGREVLGIYLKRYAPWLFSRIVRKMKFAGGSPR